MNYTELQAEIEIALAAIGTKYDLDMGDVTISLGADTVGISFTYYEDKATIKDVTVYPVYNEQSEFNRLCVAYGFKPSDYQRLIEVNNKYYKFIGFNPRARTNFCIFERDGRKYSQKIADTRRLLDN